MELQKFTNHDDGLKFYKSDYTVSSVLPDKSFITTIKGKVALFILVAVIAAGFFFGGYFVGKKYDIFSNPHAESIVISHTDPYIKTTVHTLTEFISSSESPGLLTTPGNETKTSTSLFIDNVTESRSSTQIFINTTVSPENLNFSSVLYSETTVTTTSNESTTIVIEPTVLPTTKLKWTDVNCSLPKENKCPRSFTPVILVSLDGFRPDYLMQNVTPNIQHLINCGVSTYMRSAYPTITFSNHYSIVTGLYPESHGIIDNKMYDPIIKKLFDISREESQNPEWWLGEPIWNTLHKQGKKSGIYFWPGSDVNISGMYPDAWLKYNHNTSFSTRVETVLKWLEKSDDPFNFIATYFHEPDYTGHKEGPIDSPKMKEVLINVDDTVDELMQGIYDLGLLHCVNIIIIADHGMEEISCNRTENMETFGINKKDYFVFQGAAGRIEPLRNNSFEDAMDKLLCKSPNFDVFKKEDFPKRLHYANSDRISPILLRVKPKWIIMQNANSYFCDGGTHGYDNIYSSMDALFIAYGPAFKEDYKAEPFNNFELYNLISDLLDVTPAPNNGTYGSLNYLLRQPNQSPNRSAIVPYSICEQPTDQAIIDERVEESLCDGSEIYIELRFSRSVNNIRWNLPGSIMNTSICQLINYDFVTGFSNNLSYPLWAAYHLAGQKDIVSIDINPQEKTEPDIRMEVESLPHCALYNPEVLRILNFTKGFLFPLEYSSPGQSALIASNLVLFYTNFAYDLWQKIHEYIQKCRNFYKYINVISGSVFDHNLDGLPDEFSTIPRINDLPLASHYFIILIKCFEEKEIPECKPKFLDVIAFIIPHRSKPEISCMSTDEYLKLHTAHVRDVELITGLQFFSDLEVYDALRLLVKFPGTLWKTS